MFRSLAPLMVAFFLVVSLTIPAVHAEEPAPRLAGELGPVLELLRSKNLITPEEARSLRLKGDGTTDLKGLVELLSSKGVISPEEAATLAASVGKGTESFGRDGIKPPSKDKEFVPVTLRSGENEILIKVGVQRERLGFVFRISDLDGKPFEDISNE